jgi:hypothetical protein
MGWHSIQWLDKSDICVLTDIHDPPQEGKFHSEQANTIKPEIMADCYCHMHYMDRGDRMANSYSVNCQTCKWVKGPFSYLFSLVILNSCILLTSCGGKKISHWCSTHPSEQHAGSGWTWMAARETCKETIHCSCEHCKIWNQLQLALAWSNQARVLLCLLCKRCDMESKHEISQVWSGCMCSWNMLGRLLHKEVTVNLLYVQPQQTNIKIGAKVWVKESGLLHI